MKKLTLLACSLFAFAAVAQAKEVVAPVTSSKEVVSEPVIVEEIIVAQVVPVVEESTGYINVSVGWDVWNKYKNFSDDGDQFLTKKTKDFGGQVAIEGYKTIDDFDLGLGVAYQHHAKRKTYSYTENPTRMKDSNTYEAKGAEFQSVPVYLTGKYNFNMLEWAATPYLKANLGYSFNFKSKDVNESWNGDSDSTSTSVDDGLYWAAGAGVQYENFNVELLYGVNKAKTKIKDDEGYSKKFKNDYQALTLSVGYKFDI